jgi:hypothetical protein
MAIMNVDYRSINIISTTRESATVRDTLKLFKTDATETSCAWGLSGTVVRTVTIHTTDPKRTVDAIGRHLSYDTVITPHVSFDD